jgi:uncharacterized protein YndB with AHSA1/START domain
VKGYFPLLVNSQLDRSFVALSHPARRAIVARLARGTATVGEAARGLALSKPAVSKHVKVLEEAGLVRRAIEGRRHRLRLEPQPMEAAAEWLERHRALWEAKFDAVERYLADEGREEAVLELRRRFAAPRERVFQAWTEPELLRRWWAAQPGWQGADAEVDLRPGGRYRLAMHDPESGATHAVVGEYLEVRAPERLVYTWTWEGEPPEMRGSERTVVHVAFVADGDATEVILTHRGFADTTIRDMHGQGWAGCLDGLERKGLT